MIIFYDTETSGLFPKGQHYTTHFKQFPHIVQLAFKTCNDEGYEISEANMIIKPEGYEIPKEASDIHGITTEIAIRDGIPLKNALKLFFKEACECEKLVAHNITFDSSIIKAAVLKLGLPIDPLINKIMDKRKRICTMRSTTNYCKLPGMYGYKFPRLEELYKILFGKEMEGMHNAMQDVIATKECYFELLRRKIL